MTTLVLAQSMNGQLSESSKRLVGAASAFNQPIHLLILDDEQGQTANAAAALAGVDLVLVATTSEPDLAGFDDVALLAANLADDYDVILAANTGTGRHVLPLLAARLQIAPLTGISAIAGDHLFERPIHAGALIERVQLDTEKTLLTIRPANFAAVGDQSPCPKKPCTLPQQTGGMGIIEQINTLSERPDLTEAKVVVAGGRGLGSKEGFTRLEPLADALGAALGASRIAVDMGWIPHINQVGQTGVQIAPDLYIAIGISGAVQHIAGIKDAGKIVVLNKDPDAPLFKVADYGIIGDLFDLLPQLQKALTGNN